MLLGVLKYFLYDMRYNLIFYINIRRVHRVALLKFLQGNAESLDSYMQSKGKEGWIYITKDTGDMYIQAKDNSTDGKIHLNANYANALRADNTLNSGLSVGSNKSPVYFENGIPKQAAIPRIFYGTCTTAAATAAKSITISTEQKWELVIGNILVIKFSYTNTAQNPYFLINNGITKNIYYNTSKIVQSNLSYAGMKDCFMTYMYDGENFVFLGYSKDNDTTYTNLSLGQAYGTCPTAAATTTKASTIDGYTLVNGGIVSIKFTYAVPSNATLNISGTGAKAIYHRGSIITANIIESGDTATFIYNGSQYHLISLDKDTKVTSVNNHYMPNADSSKLLSVDASSNTSATWGSTNLVTGVNIQRDAAGHVTGLTLDSIRMPAQPSSGDTVKVTAANDANVYTYLVGVKSTIWTSTTPDTNQQSALYIPANTNNGKGPRVKLSDGTLWGAVWNDYAECRETADIEPGRVVCETGKGDLILSTERLQAGANVVSDTFGFIIGETSKAKTPIAVSGRVLAYPLEDRTSYAAGDAVCAGPNGTVSKMTREEIREYPDRILGTVSEIPDYEVWGENNIIVDGRIWIKVR